MAAFTETVTVVRQVVDNWGNHTAGATHDVDGCAVWPFGVSGEVVVGEDTVTWDMYVLMPAGSDVVATDRVIVRGITYDVVGEPIRWISPLTGRQPGVQVNLKTATG